MLNTDSIAVLVANDYIFVSHACSFLWRDAASRDTDATQSAVMQRHYCLCLSVTLRYRDHIGWKIFKNNSVLVSLEFALRRPHHHGSAPRGTSGLGVGCGKSAQSLLPHPPLQFLQGTFGFQATMFIYFR